MAGSSTAETGARGPTGRFYFDFADPAAYLEAERLRVEDLTVEWVPILRPPAPRCAEEVAALREDVERGANAMGLQPVRWPDRFPFDSERAMLAATYAKSIGRAVAFALAAFRQVYAAGRPLDVDDNIVIAGAACEMHPRALLTAIGTRGTREALERATATATATATHLGRP